MTGRSLGMTENLHSSSDSRTAIVSKRMLEKEVGAGIWDAAGTGPTWAHELSGLRAGDVGGQQNDPARSRM